jgi:SAM-dependent methyltransferase
MRRLIKMARGPVADFALLNYGKFQRLYWDLRARDIDEQWGSAKDDYKLLSDIIDECNVESVLDLGCGLGRLFALYQSKNITEVIGVDISRVALKLANKAFPTVKTERMRLEDIDFEYRRFDLVISNRTL